MKKLLIVLFCSLFTGLAVHSQTQGTLSVNVMTKGTGLEGRNYAPKNSMVIWVEDEAGNFVKTLLLNAQVRVRTLDNWEASTSKAGSLFNAVDAVTGPTNNSHGIRNCAWDGTDAKGNLMPDGTYVLHMELTDRDAAGLTSEFTFNKGPKKQALSPQDQTSFASIQISWTPD